MVYKRSAPGGEKHRWTGTTMEGFLGYLDDAEKARDNGVITVLKLMQELQSPDKNDKPSTIADKKSLLDSKLGKYRFIPDLLPRRSGRGWTREWHVLPVGRKGLSRAENSALDMVLWYALAGKLALLRKCADCSRWYEAKVEHQTFCSPACQQKHYRHSEKGKVNKRLYMRKYRRM
jgi:hypothetical protein